MEFYDRKTVKTRKPHNCHLCPVIIPRGTSCEYEAGKYDGEFFWRYSHPECSKVWQKLNEGLSGDEDWCLLGDVLTREELSEHVKFIKLRYGG